MTGDRTHKYIDKVQYHMNKIGTRLFVAGERWQLQSRGCSYV